jgi:hypothetical protein
MKAQCSETLVKFYQTTRYHMPGKVFFIVTVLSRGTWRGGGAPFWGLWKICKEGFEMEHLSLCRGSIRGTWRGGGGFTVDSQKHVREGFGRGASLSCGGPVRGAWRQRPHTEDMERCVSEGSGNGVFLFAGAPWREPKGMKQGRARPIRLLGRNPSWIYFSVMGNLRVLVALYWASAF